MIHCASQIVLLNSLLPLEQSHLPWESTVPPAGSLSTASGTGTICFRKCSVTVQVHRETSCDNRLGLWLLLCRLTCVFAVLAGAEVSSQLCKGCGPGSSLNRSLVACPVFRFGYSKSLLKSCAVVVPFLRCSILPLDITILVRASCNLPFSLGSSKSSPFLNKYFKFSCLTG